MRGIKRCIKRMNKFSHNWMARSKIRSPKSAKTVRGIRGKKLHLTCKKMEKVRILTEYVAQVDLCEA